MLGLEGLEGFAVAIASLIGILAILSPFINKIKRFEFLQFNHPKLFTVIAEFVTIGILLWLVFYRAILPTLWPFWIFIIAGIIIIIILIPLSEFHRNQPGPFKLVIGAIGYTVAIGSIFLGIGIGTAEILVFRNIKGTVLDNKNNPITHTRVILLTGGTTTKQLKTHTNKYGEYTFLLTDDEYKLADEIQIGSFFPLNPNSLVLTGQQKCVDSERTCNVPNIKIEN